MQDEIEMIAKYLGVEPNLQEILEAISILKSGYQPWRARRGEILSQPEISEVDRQELNDLDQKLSPLGYSVPLGYTHEQVRGMQIIQDFASRLSDLP